MADKSKDGRKVKSKKIKADTGANLPTLSVFSLLGIAFLAILAAAGVLAGFFFLPPLTIIAATIPLGLLAMLFYRLILYVSSSRSVVVARIMVGLSAVFIGYVYACMTLCLLEAVGPEPIPPENWAETATILGKGFITGYFLRPLELFESYLYYSGGWLVVMLAAPLVLVVFSQFSTGGVNKRRAAVLAHFHSGEEDEQPPETESLKTEEEPEPTEEGKKPKKKGGKS